MSLKAKIKNIAQAENISAQAVLQNYLLSRFLFRLSGSSYRNRFIVKGGMLISSVIGIGQRATMDLDTTLRGMSLTEAAIEAAFREICAVPAGDGLSFRLGNIGPIRDDDEYGGFRVNFFAEYGKINAPMSMDISTGDIITPGAEKHLFKDMFDSTVTFELWAYPLETVLAEKLETILSRGVDNTRPRDFYDVYKLSPSGYHREVLKDAFEATASHRESLLKIGQYGPILDTILADRAMAERWVRYTEQMPYAAGIPFETVVEAVRDIMKSIR